MKSTKWTSREEVVAFALQLRETAVTNYDAGERDNVVEQFEEALLLLESAAGPFEDETVLCMRYLSVVHMNATEINKQARAIGAYLDRNREHAVDKKGWDVVDQFAADLAEGFRLMGDFDQALATWNDCIAAQEDRGPEGSAALAHTLTEAGSCCLWQGDTIAALEYLDRALAMLRAEDAIVEDKLLALDRSAYAHSNLGHFEEAIACAEEGVKLARDTNGPKSTELSVARRRLADVLVDMGRLEEAVKILEESAKFDRETLGMSHNNSITSSSRLASAYEALGRHSDSIELYEECLEKVRQLRPFAHQEIGSYLNNLANNYEKLDMFEKAIAFYEDDLSTSLEVLGTSHPDTITSMINLAEMYSGLGRFSDAQPLLERGLQAAEGLPRDIGRGSVSFALKCNGFQATRLGDYTKGMEFIGRAMAVVKEKVGRLHLEVAYTRTGMAEILRRSGRFEKSAQHVSKLMQSFEAAFGKDHPRTIRGSAMRGRLYSDQGRYDDAIEIFEAVIKVTEETQGRRSCVGEQYVRLGLAYEGKGMYAKARELVKEGISLWAPLGDLYVNKYRAETILARLHFKDGNIEEATQTLAKAIAVIERLVPTHPWLGEALITMARIRLYHKEHETAKEELKKAKKLFEGQILPSHPMVVEATTLLNALDNFE